MNFQIGEVAIYIRPGSPFYGREVTIISGLQEFENGLDLLTGGKYPSCIGYVVSVGEISPKGKDEWCAVPSWLKRKPQTRELDQIVSWDDCPWKPRELQTA